MEDFSKSSENFPYLVVIHTVKGFGIVNKAEIDIFLELSYFFIIQRMLAIWFLIPLLFINPTWAKLVEVIEFQLSYFKS